MSADDGQTKSFVLNPPSTPPPPSFPPTPGSEDVPPSHKAAFIPSTTTTSTSTTTTTISDTKQHSWVSMRSGLWWSLHRYWKSPNAKSFTDRPTALMIWSWRRCRGKSLIESRATVITSNQSYGWRFLLGLNGMQMARYKKKVGHHLYMTPFHRQTQNMSDLTSDRMPCFEPKRLGASLGLGHKVEISQLWCLQTTRGAQFVQLWTTPDTKGITCLYEWRFLFLDNQGFPFLAKAIVAYLTTIRLCPKSLRVSCPVWHKHSAFFLYLQKQLPPHCVLSSMECVFGSHFSFAAATHFWAFVGMVGVLGVMLTRCEMKKIPMRHPILAMPIWRHLNIS